MTISQVADIADLLTALGVIISLLFVLFELRHTNREGRLANSLALTQIVSHVRGLTDDPVMADIVIRGRKSMDDLSEAEAMVYQKYLLRVVHTWVSVYRVAERSLAGRAANQSVAIESVRAEWDYPGPRDWWLSVRDKPPFVPAAKQLLEEALDMEDAK